MHNRKTEPEALASVRFALEAPETRTRDDDRYLADQLVTLAAIAGGRIRIPAVTEHVATSLHLLESFGMETSVTDAGGASVEGDELVIESGDESAIVTIASPVGP